MRNVRRGGQGSPAEDLPLALEGHLESDGGPDAMSQDGNSLPSSSTSAPLHRLTGLLNALLDVMVPATRTREQQDLPGAPPGSERGNVMRCTAHLMLREWAIRDA